VSLNGGISARWRWRWSNSARRSRPIGWDSSATELARDIAETDKRIAALREKVKSDGEGKASTASTRLAEVSKELEAQEQQLDAMEKRIQAYEADREGVIRATVEADTTYVRKEDGFLARLRAMREITHQDETTFFVIVLLDIFLFAFEASILLLKIFGANNRYAELVAGEDMIQTNEIVHELAETINARSAAPPNLRRQRQRRKRWRRSKTRSPMHKMGLWWNPMKP
jgi:hypothetical protein